MPRPMLPLVAALLAVTVPAAAEEQATGRANVEGIGGPLGGSLTPNGNVLPGGTGLSLAGGGVFGIGPAIENYAISGKFLSNRPPGDPLGGPDELAQMQLVMQLTKTLTPLGGLQLPFVAATKQRLAAEAAFAAGALQAFKPVLPQPPATVGDFTRIFKGVLDTGTVTAKDIAVDNGEEIAEARATQNAIKSPNSIITTDTEVGGSIVASAMLPNPQAASYAVNIDPSAVDWTSLSARTVQLDLTGLQLQASTTGPAEAVATDIFTGAFRNGTTDITMPEVGATHLFSLSLGVFDYGDTPATALTSLSYLGGNPNNLTVNDSEGGNGLAAVAADLAASFIAGPNGTYTIANFIDPSEDYTITMTVPGSVPNSVLYFDEVASTAAAAVPEPTTVVLLGTVLPLVRRLRHRRSVSPQA
jgi:hypothetical protein